MGFWSGRVNSLGGDIGRVGDEVGVICEAERGRGLARSFLL